MKKAKPKVGMIQVMGFYHACMQITSARCHLETGNRSLQSASGPGEALQAKSVTLLQPGMTKAWIPPAWCASMTQNKHFHPNPERN